MNQGYKTHPSLKVGLLTVSTIWFLFSFHELFKAMVNINEFVYVAGPNAFWIMITDYSGVVGLIARTLAGLIAVVTVVLYIKGRFDSPSISIVRALHLILLAEAIYWLSLILSGVWGIIPIEWAAGNFTKGLSFGLHFDAGFLIETGLPCIVESIAIPAALFKIVYELRPKRPAKNAIKWGLITFAIYVFVYWLNNTGNWIYTIYYTPKGISYLINHPANLLSFVLTTIGLLALTIFAASFAKKSSKIQNIKDLKMKTLGALIVLLGLYFLWNYLTWIFFGNNQLWSQWYAWFLGHNMDLWLMAIPLVGLPLLYELPSSQRSTGNSG
jgi:hypothetical protein